MKLAKTLTMLGALLAIAVVPVMGQELETPGGTKHFHLAPETLPFKGAAISGVPVASLQVDEDNGTTTGQDAHIGEVVISVGGSSPHGVNATNITGVKLYKAKGGGTQTWDFATYPTGLTDITGTVVLNDTTDEITFTINDSFAIVEEGSTDVTLFVTIDYATTLDTETNVIYSFKSISYGASDGATTFTLDSGSAPALRGLDNSIVTSTDIYDYVVTFGGADAVVNANEEEGTEDLVVLRVDLGGGVPDEAANKDVESITFAYTGTTTADVPAASVRLYYDADGSGAFEIANDSLVATGTSWSGTDITLAIPDTIAYATADAELDNDIDAAEESFFLLLNIADLGGAGVGRTIGFEVVDESSTDVQFYDSIDDYIEGTTAGIGFTTFEYDQSGYVTTSAGLASSLITIDPKTVIDTTPPTIIASNPSDATAGVSRNLATIALTFDDLMFDDSGLGDPGSVTTLANYSMTGPTTVTLSGVTFNSGNRTATLTVDSGSLPLQYEGDYTVTVVNVENTDGYGMISDSILFTIEAESPPTVLGTIPADGSTDAAIGTSVGIIFSEAMDETTITNEANFSLFAEGAAEEVPGAMTYTASGNTATFTPDASLTFSTSYTATATTGVTDAEGSPLAADYTFSFTTASAAGSLSFTDIIVANNRIVPGSTDPMRIFIETPEGLNAADVVTIGVYTSTGRRVATLTTAGETYADVIARQPIEWYGTNDRGQPLGPGLYFVQVSSAGYRRALRVMIVR